MKKLIAILLVAVMLLSAVACTKDPVDDPVVDPGTSDSDNNGGEVVELTYDEKSAALYDEVLGEFFTSLTH